MTKQELMKELNLSYVSVCRWVRLSGSDDLNVIKQFMKERHELAKQHMKEAAVITPERLAHLRSIASHPHTDESKAKLSKALKGHKVSEETKQRMSTAFKGRKYSDEMKSKLSASQRKRLSAVKDDIKDYCNKNNLITAEEAADILKCGVTTFRRYYAGQETITYKRKDLFDKQLLVNSPLQNMNAKGCSHYENEIAELFDRPKLNDRQTIKPFELDIIEGNIAVEFDGLYWHSNKPKDYHLNKTKACENKDIRLIHIFEDEWRDKKEICKSLIRSALGKYERKYMARNLEFNTVDKETAKQFLEENHIQGSCRFIDAYGLYDNDELIQLVCFRKNFAQRNSKDIELARMVTKMGCQVVGGFSKLMKHCPYDYVTSFVDRRLFNASGYKNSGWNVIGESVPSYFYTDGVNRFNRQQYMKQTCIKMWPKLSQNLTEEEMCNANGLYRIYDCGCIKVEWHKVS